MRLVHASFLLDHYRFGGSFEGLIAEPLRHEDDHVLKVALRVGYDFLIHHRRRMLPGADRIGRHADHLGWRNFAVQMHRSAESSPGSGWEGTARSHRMRN